MRINGQQVTKPVQESLYLPRGDHQLQFLAEGLPDMEEFDKLCPEPKPPGKLTKDGWVPNPDDEGYRQILANYNAQRLGYMVVYSLAPSNIEWDIVKPDNPATWAKWSDDMKVAGLTHVEIRRVLQLVLDANSLNEAKIEKARELFRLGKEAASGATTSQSSEPANS